MSLPVAAPRLPRRVGRVNWIGLATLYRRELRRVLREWLETVAGPVFAAGLYLTVFAFALGGDRTSAEGAAVLTFILPGLAMFAILERAAETTVFSIVFDKLEGIIADVLMPPLSASELVAAHALAATSAALITGAPVVGFAVLVFDMGLAAPPLALAFAAGGALMLALTGILIGLWAAKWDHAAAFFAFLLIPLTFLSGLFAPVEALPELLEGVIRLNPIFYVIDGFRAATLGLASAPPMASLAVVTATDLMLWVACDRLVTSGWRLKP